MASDHIDGLTPFVVI